jgi:CHAD domain-containing protein
MGPPLGPWAARRIARAWRRLRKHASDIGEGSPESQLHEVRLDGKRLRYLLEFFRSLRSAEEIDPLVKELKRFQDTLGAFNDARVQQVVLRDAALELGRRGAGAEVLMAIGRLTERVEWTKSAERAKFAKRWKRFDAGTNRERFRLLFGSGGKSRSSAPGDAVKEGST